MKHIKLFEQFINEDKSKKNRFLGIFGPGKDIFQRKIKKVSSSEIEKLIQYTESSGDEVERSGKNAWGITKESGKDNQVVWQYLDDVLYFENPNYPSIYDSYIRKELNESLTESTDYILKDDSGQGKPTMVLKLELEAWEKVKHLFDKEGRPTSELTRIPAFGYTWDLYASEYTQGDKVMHKIYGVSGDYTFGNAPTFYQQKYRGNKKAAKEVFNWFIEKYLK